MCVCKDMDVLPIQPKKSRPSSWYKLGLRFKEINRTLFLPRLRYMRELGHPLADTLEHSGYSECRDLPTRLTLVKDVGVGCVLMSNNWAFFQQKAASVRLARLGRRAWQMIVSNGPLVSDRMLTRAA